MNRLSASAMEPISNTIQNRYLVTMQPLHKLSFISAVFLSCDLLYFAECQSCIAGHASNHFSLLTCAASFPCKIIPVSYMYAYPDTKKLWMGEYAVLGNLMLEVECGICSPPEAFCQCQHQQVLLNESVSLDLSRILQVLLLRNQSQEPGDMYIDKTIRN